MVSCRHHHLSGPSQLPLRRRRPHHTLASFLRREETTARHLERPPREAPDMVTSVFLRRRDRLIFYCHRSLLFASHSVAPTWSHCRPLRPSAVLQGNRFCSPGPIASISHSRASAWLALCDLWCPIAVSHPYFLHHIAPLLYAIPAIPSLSAICHSLILPRWPERRRVGRACLFLLTYSFTVICTSRPSFPTFLLKKGSSAVLTHLPSH